MWDEYPGIQSNFIPADGIAHECITSLEEINNWIRTSVGIAIAPVACIRIIFEIPFLKGRYWFFCNSKKVLSLNSLKCANIVLLKKYENRYVHKKFKFNPSNIWVSNGFIQYNWKNNNDW